MGTDVVFSIGRAQFYGVVGFVVVLAATFAWTTSAELRDTAAATRHAASVAEESRDESRAATRLFHSVNVRLTRIETLLEQALKDYGERLVKLESWRDGPQRGPFPKED